MFMVYRFLASCIHLCNKRFVVYIIYIYQSNSNGCNISNLSRHKSVNNILCSSLHHNAKTWICINSSLQLIWYVVVFFIAKQVPMKSGM